MIINKEVNMKLNVKLYLLIGGTVVLAFIIFGIFVYNYQKNAIDASYQEAMQEYLNNYTQMINLEVESKKISSQIAINTADTYLKSLGTIQETNEKVTVGEHQVNKWILNGKQLQLDESIVNTISSFGIKSVSFFQKTPKGYVRVSTNVRNKEGKLVLGTVVTYDNPVAQAIEKGEKHTGRIWIVDTWYLASFTPIRINGKIAGMIGVGEPEINYQGLSADFKTKNYYGSGYPYIIDDKGILTAHPQSVGLNLSEYPFFKEMKEKKNGTVVYEWKGRMKTQHFRYLESINSFITVGYYNDDYEAMFSKLRTTILIAVLIALAIVVGIIFTIVRSVMKQLGADPKDVQEIANKVAEGDFSMNINLMQGDTNSLLASMNKMVQTIKAMVQDVQRLGNSASEGKLDVRADATKFQGEYKQLVQGLNNTLDAIIGPLNVAAEYIDRISKGDIPPKITDVYKGDFNEIKNNINQCIDAINLLIKDTYDLAEYATMGRLNERANAERHQGDFRRLIQGINSTLDRLVGLIDNMPIPVRIVDKNNNVLYINKNNF